MLNTAVNSVKSAAKSVKNLVVTQEEPNVGRANAALEAGASYMVSSQGMDFDYFFNKSKKSAQPQEPQPEQVKKAAAPYFEATKPSTDAPVETSSVKTGDDKSTAEASGQPQQVEQQTGDAPSQVKVLTGEELVKAAGQIADGLQTTRTRNGGKGR